MFGLYFGLFAGGQPTWTNFYELVDFISLSVTDGLGSGSDSLSARMVKTLQPDLPQAGQAVRLVIGGVKLFEGVLGSTGTRWLHGGSSVEIDLSAVSYAHLLGRRLVAERELPAERAGARIRRLLRTYAPEFAADLSGIADGPVIGPTDYDYVNIPSIISGLAGEIGYLWYVDFDRRVHFFADLDSPAPVSTVDIDTETRLGDFEVSVDAQGVVNVVFLKDYASRSRNKHSHQTVADGKSSFFSLPLGPFALEDTEVYVKPEGSPDWVKKTVVADPLDGRSESTVGVPGLSYVCVFNWGVRFPTSDMPKAGDTVRADFHPEIPDRVTVVVDEDSIADCARKEGTDGRHEMSVSLSDWRVADDTPVEALGGLILRRKAWPIVTGSFVVRTVDYGSWKPGQFLDIISVARGIFDYKAWARSGYTVCRPLRVWVTSVKRSFELTSSGVIERDNVEFSSLPWEDLR